MDNQKLNELNELRKKGFSNRAASREVGIAESTARRWNKKRIEVKENKPKYIVTKDNRMQWEHKHGDLEIDLSTLDNVFNLYSRHGKNWTMLEVQNYLNFTASEFKSFKDAFDLVKESSVWSEYTLSLQPNDKARHDIINERIAKNYSKQNTRESIVLAVRKQKSAAYGKALKRIAEFEYKRQDFENTLLDYVSKAKEKTYVRRVKTKGKNHGVHTVQDIHIGADVAAAPHLEAYNTKVIQRKLKDVAEKINQQDNAKNTICLNGDLIETFTGLNHINSWKGIDKNNGYGAKATTLACDILKEFLLKIDNIYEVLIVAGNHDRTTSNNKEDVDGEVVHWLHYVLKLQFGHKFKVNKSSDVITRVIDKVCYIWTHGHLILAKRSPAELVNMFGNANLFNLVVQGHHHTRKILADTVRYRVIVGAPIITGNEYSKRLGLSALSGFTSSISDGKYPVVTDIPIK